MERQKELQFNQQHKAKEAEAELWGKKKSEKRQQRLEKKYQ